MNTKKVYPVARLFIPPLVRHWIGKCTGIENIPEKGAILAANHASYFDHFVVDMNIILSTNRIPSFLAKKEHFDVWHERLWHNFMKAIPIDRQAGGQKALKKAISHLKKGNLIMIYPEGTRTLDGKLHRAKTGVARLALAAKVPVVPMGITNTFKMMPKGKKIPKFGMKADLYIGKPLYFEKYYSRKDSKQILRKVTTKIMKEIAKLAGQKYPYD